MLEINEKYNYYLIEILISQRELHPESELSFLEKPTVTSGVFFLLLECRQFVYSDPWVNNLFLFYSISRSALPNSFFYFV